MARARGDDRLQAEMSFEQISEIAGGVPPTAHGLRQLWAAISRLKLGRDDRAGWQAEPGQSGNLRGRSRSRAARSGDTVHAALLWSSPIARRVERPMVACQRGRGAHLAGSHRVQSLGNPLGRVRADFGDASDLVRR